MKQITLQNFPSFVAVIDGRSDFAAALPRAKMALLNPQYQAVVIIRDSSTLTESASRCEAMLNNLSAHYNSVGCLSDGRYAELGMTDDVQHSYETKPFIDYIGIDITDVLEGIKQNFASVPSIDVRCSDGANVFAHIDSGHEYKAANDNLSQIFSQAGLQNDHLPGGITLTISLRGGGSLISEISRNDVRRTCGDAGHMVWELCEEEQTIGAHSGWQTCDGDVCLMRAGDWPEEYLPTLHSSPARSYPEDPKERLVGVAFL